MVDSAGIVIKDLGGACELRDAVVEFNTLAGTGASFEDSALTFMPTDEGPWVKAGTGPVAFRSNIVVSQRRQYFEAGLVDIGTYASAALYAAVVPTGNLVFTANAYHHPSASPRFNLFAAGVAPLGASCTWAQWQTRGFDAGGFLGDPGLDAAYVPTNPACGGKGRFAGVDPYVTWQFRHFTFEEIARGSVAEPDADPDGDGASNAQEFLGGTDPRVPDSAGPTLSIVPAVAVQWLAQAGAVYQVQVSTEAVVWTNLGSPVRGDGTVQRVFETTPEHARRFYRVVRVSK
jgi:hypothetical protein